MPKRLAVSLALLVSIAAVSFVVPLGATQGARAATLAPAVVVMLENEEDVKFTATNAPYLTSLKSQGRYFSRYYGVAHPSFANYIALAGGSTFGFTGGTITPGMIPGPSLWDQLTTAGLSWGVYEELVPKPCFPNKTKVGTGHSKDKYGIGHDPGIAFDSVYTSAECQQVLPLTSMPTTLPAVSLVTPSYCDDMHGVRNLTYPADCQRKSVDVITRSDSWLRDHVEAWRAAGAIVIITFDEGNTDVGTGGHIYTIEVGAGVSTSVEPATYNHYSLLAGLEDRFGLARLRNAANAAPVPIG